MNQGGDQGHDDYGLPRVDIEIPDDARELYRDVLAYHRELRALRRHARSMRWRAPFRRSGIAIPLLAGCLVAALVAVMVSAMFTANPYSNGNAGARPSIGGRSSGTAPSSGRPTTSVSSELAGPSPKPSVSIAQLPAETINVAGKSVALRTLISAALAIVPTNCQLQCNAAVRELLMQAETAGVILYLVVPRGSSVARLDRLVTATARRTRSTRVATDSDNALTSAYRPVGLTVLLVDSHGAVTVDSRLGPDLMLEKQLMLLRRTR